MIRALRLSLPNVFGFWVLLLGGCPQAFVVEDRPDAGGSDAPAPDVEAADVGGDVGVAGDGAPSDVRRDTFVGFDGGPPPTPTCEGLIEASPILEMSCRDPAHLEVVERTDRFGEALAIGDGELFVGAPGFELGSVTVYGAADGGYRQTQSLLRTGIGWSLAVRGARLLVGAPSESTDDDDDDDYDYTGVVIEYERQECGWVRTRLIDSPATGTARDRGRFGASIALHDDFAIIGSGKDESEEAGEANVYYSMQYTDEGWTLTDTLSCGTHSAQQHRLHSTISADGQNILLRNDQDGVLCLFSRAGTDALRWNLISETRLDDAVNFQGANVSVSDNFVFVGSSSLRFVESGIRTQAGAVRVFTLTPGGLTELPEMIIREPMPTTRHEFGAAVHAECDSMSRECALWVAAGDGSEDADEAGVLWRVVWHEVEGVRSMEPLSTCAVGSQGEIGMRAVFRGDEAFVSSPYYGQAWLAQ